MAAFRQQGDLPRQSNQLADLPAPWFYSLVREQLSPEDRLSLFQACTSLACSIQRYAASSQLVLDAGCADSDSTPEDRGCFGSGNSSSTGCSNDSGSSSCGCSNDSGSSSCACSNDGSSSCGRSSDGSGDDSSCSRRCCHDDSSSSSYDRSSCNSSLDTCCCHSSAATCQQHARFVALQSVAAGAVDLHLVLHKGVPSLMSSLPAHCIAHLTLEGVSLNANMLQHVLQLGQFKHLHTLTLGSGTTSQFTLQELDALSKQLCMVVPPSLTHLEMGEMCDLGIMQLLAPQLTHLHTSARWDSSRRQLVSALRTASFSSLKHVHITWYLTDPILDALLGLPALQYVSTGSVTLQYDHSQVYCTWQQLTVRCGTSVEMLANLPLQGISRVVVHEHLSCPIQQDTDRMQLSTARVAAYQNLQLVPALDPLTTAAFGLPVFTLSGDYTKQLLLLCARALGESPVALRCCGFTLSTGVALLPSFSHLPPNIQLLWFSFASQPGHIRPTIPPTQEDCLPEWQQVVSQLPTSVTQVLAQPYTQVVLHHPTSTEEVCRPNAAALAKALQQAMHPALLTVLHSRYLCADPRLDLLAAEHAGKVRVLCANIS